MISTTQLNHQPRLPRERAQVRHTYEDDRGQPTSPQHRIQPLLPQLLPLLRTSLSETTIRSLVKFFNVGNLRRGHQVWQQRAATTTLAKGGERTHQYRQRVVQRLIQVRGSKRKKLRSQYIENKNLIQNPFFVGGLRFDYANLTIAFFVFNKSRRQHRKIQ